jgi:3-dehydroquinate synthase
MSQTIPVSLGARSYDVQVGHGVLARAGELTAPHAPPRRVFIDTARNAARLHLAALERAHKSAGLAHATITMPPGERTKSFRGLEKVSRELLQANITRKDIVIAFGGGVIGDLAGLAAGLVKRGVAFVQLPTTLLAQVDLLLFLLFLKYSCWYRQIRQYLHYHTHDILIV